MTRRAASLAVAALTLVVLVTVAFSVQLPYVVMSPGLTENTLGTFDGEPVISIDGQRTYPTSGRLDLTTVSVTRPEYRPRLPEVLSAWWSDEEAVLPEEAIYSSDRSAQEYEKEKAQQMLDSQSAAIAAGLGQAGFDAVEVTVQAVEKGFPADGELEPGDAIVTVNGKETGSAGQVATQIKALPVGSPVTMRIRRDGEPMTVRLTTTDGGDGTSRIGITTGEAYNPPFDVNIDLGQEIGGPSAGLMFSLGIYDKLTPGALTGGRFVAGTGTIDAAGKVGEIGGIQQKIAAAEHAGAEVFLAPAGDCAEALESAYADDLELIKVTNIRDAVSSLEALDSGDTAAIPRCGE